MTTIDRSRLIALAPKYYTCALCVFFFRENNDAASYNTLKNISGVSHGPTFSESLNYLEKNGLITKILDDFGPPIYLRSDKFSEIWQEMREEQGTPYYKWDIDPQGNSWLSAALIEVNKALEEQNITEEDFSSPDLEWQPIPIDRPDQKLDSAIEAIDQAITEIKQDNGYSANVPGERDLVIDNLTSGISKLKNEDKVSFAYLRRMIIDPLTIVIHRFGTAALGLTATAARQALFDWLKDRSSDLIHWISRWN